MNNQLGRAHVIEHHNAIDTITLSLSCENVKTKLAVLEILGKFWLYFLLSLLDYFKFSEALYQVNTQLIALVFLKLSLFSLPKTGLKFYG